MGGRKCEIYLFYCKGCGKDREAWRRYCDDAPPKQEGKEREWCRPLIPRQTLLFVCPDCREKGLTETEEEKKDWLLIDELKGRHGSRAF